MTLQEKIKKIVSAIKSGVSIYKIDPIGKGCSAKMLLQGKLPTQKKILQMYTHLLVVEQEQQIAQDNKEPESNDDSDYILNEKLRLKKIQVLFEAANAGVPHNVMDPKGNGGSVRRLLKGGTPTVQKLDSMYDKLIEHQQQQLLEKKEQFLILNPHEPKDNEQKKAFILQAVQSGIQKGRIDTFGAGKSIRRLQDGKGVLQVTLDMMYSNLLAIMGYTDEAVGPPERARQSWGALQNQIDSLQNVVASLVDRLKFLETAVTVLQNEIQPAKKNTPEKILGATLMLKADRVRGKKYRRWYALYLDRHGKKRWIYIGTHVSKAKDKILAWFARHPEDVATLS